MTKNQTEKILTDFKKSLEGSLPETKKQIGMLWLCISEIFEEMIYLDKSKLPKKSLSKRNKKEINFDNILQICITSVKLLNKNDFESLLTSFGNMDAKLFDIENNAHKART